jgi:hypothetical protein
MVDFEKSPDVTIYYGMEVVSCELDMGTEDGVRGALLQRKIYQ